MSRTDKVEEKIIGIMDLPPEIQYLIIDLMDYDNLKYFKVITDRPNVASYIEKAISRKLLDKYQDVLERYPYEMSQKDQLVIDEILSNIDVEKINMLFDKYPKILDGDSRLPVGTDNLLLKNNYAKILANADYDTLRYIQSLSVDITGFINPFKGGNLEELIFVSEEALRNNNLDFFRFIADMGIDFTNRRILEKAAELGNLDFFKLLADYGEYFTDPVLLEKANMYGHHDLVKFLSR